MTVATLADLLADVRRKFAGGGIEEPAREARLLVGGILKLEAAALISDGGRAMTEADAARDVFKLSWNVDLDLPVKRDVRR